MSWTQPICARCFGAEMPGRVPMRLRDAQHEICCYCGHQTCSGIYIRVNPAEVPYPTNNEGATA